MRMRNPTKPLGPTASPHRASPGGKTEAEGRRNSGTRCPPGLPGRDGRDAPRRWGLATAQGSGGSRGAQGLRAEGGGNAPANRGAEQGGEQRAGD